MNMLSSHLQLSQFATFAGTHSISDWRVSLYDPAVLSLFEISSLVSPPKNALIALPSKLKMKKNREASYLVCRLPPPLVPINPMICVICLNRFRLSC